MVTVLGTYKYTYTLFRSPNLVSCWPSAFCLSILSWLLPKCAALVLQTLLICPARTRPLRLEDPMDLTLRQMYLHIPCHGRFTFRWHIGGPVFHPTFDHAYCWGVRFLTCQSLVWNIQDITMLWNRASKDVFREVGQHVLANQDLTLSGRSLYIPDRSEL